MLERQDLEMQEKVEAHQTAVGPEKWSNEPGRGATEKGQNQTFGCDQSKPGASVPEAGPGDVGTACDRSCWDKPVHEGVESVSECPTLQSGNNTISVIVCIPGSGETAGNAAATACSAPEAGREEVRGDNQSVSTATQGSQTSPAATKHPGKVIVTNVTLNSVTVTFKEATVAEGFFKGY